MAVQEEEFDPLPPEEAITLVTSYLKGSPKGKLIPTMCRLVRDIARRAYDRGREDERLSKSTGVIDMLDLDLFKQKIVLVAGHVNAHDKNWLWSRLKLLDPKAIVTSNASPLSLLAREWAAATACQEVRYPTPNIEPDLAAEWRDIFMVEHAGIGLALLTHGPSAIRLSMLCLDAGVEILSPGATKA